MSGNPISVPCCLAPGPQQWVFKWDRASRREADRPRSAGALASALAACDVDFLAATELAYGLAVKHDLYNRRLGLVGVWGGLVREWLDELLPDNAADVCRGKVFVHTWDVPSFSRRPYTDFASKQDLIDCLLASVHIVRPSRARRLHRRPAPD